MIAIMDECLTAAIISELHGNMRSGIARDLPPDFRAHGGRNAGGDRPHGGSGESAERSWLMPVWPALRKYLPPVSQRDTGRTNEEAREPHSSVRGGGADPANPCADGMRTSDAHDE